MQIQIYVHIPFCLRKCGYCDFNSVASSVLAPSDYVNVVIREMELRRRLLPETTEGTTIYFGGGTPSLLSPGEIARIIDCAAGLYGLATDAEVTLEANPGTVTAETLAGYRAAGVTRLSLGVQSFDDALLERIGRIHSADEAREAVATAYAAGFRSVGIDLIHSLPGQTLGMLEDDLAAALALRPTHLSVYGLTVESGTPFGDLLERDELDLPEEDEVVAMFRRTPEILAAAGYDHYEISNYALAGYRSRHNTGYWRRCPYLGFGAGAHSFLAAARWGNVADIASYADRVFRGLLPAEEVVELSRRDEMAEWMFLGLRLLDGVRPSEFERDFGTPLAEVFGDSVEGLVREGHLLRGEDRLRLAPAAVIVSNQVFSRFT